MELAVVSIDLQCRICLDIQESEEEMTSLFEIMEGDFTLSDILTNISNIVVQANENVPSNVCNSCLATVINFHNLLLQFQQSEQFFKKTFIDSLSKERVSDDNDCITQSTIEDNVETDEQYYDKFEETAEIDIKDVHISSTNPCHDLDKNDLKDRDNICKNFKYVERNNEIFFKNNQNKTEDQEYKLEPKDPFFTESSSEKLIEETDNEIITESLKYSCTECGDAFLFKVGFNQHMLQKHNKHLREDEYVKYSSKIIIKQPKMFPEIIKIPKTILMKIQNQLQCRICKKCFESDSELKEHVNIHKIHVCPVCGLAFLKKYYLTDHIVVHSADRNFICHICNASFRHRNALTAHRNSHKTFRDYTCETCGHSFKDKGTLKVHIKLKHSDIRNYACSKCPLKFKLKSFLDKHFIRRHTKRTKDFICSDCGVAYLNKTTLMRHISEKHSGKNPEHICAICSKSFRVRLSLNKHLQSIHKIEINK